MYSPIDSATSRTYALQLIWLRGVKAFSAAAIMVVYFSKIITLSMFSEKGNWSMGVAVSSL